MHLITQAIDLMLPYKCDICGGYAGNACYSGLDAIYRKIYGEDNKCHICSNCMSLLIPLEEDRRWFTLLTNPIEGDPYADLALFMPFTYSGIVESAMRRIKFSGMKELARVFGIIMGLIIRQENILMDMIIPVPLSRARLAERGFNQAYELAYPIGVINRCRVDDSILYRTKDTKRQSELKDSVDRTNNVSDAFAVNDDWDLSGMRILLVDDVATTGHTLRESAVPLIKAGSGDVLCAAFAGNRQMKNAEPF